MLSSKLINKDLKESTQARIGRDARKLLPQLEDLAVLYFFFYNFLEKCPLLFEIYLGRLKTFSKI